jgi:LuxR family maltose regulon positive regulatory protein
VHGCDEDDLGCRPERLEPKHRPDPAFDGSVVLLDEVVQILDWRSSMATPLSATKPCTAAALAPLLSIVIFSDVPVDGALEERSRRFDLSPHTVKRHVANILDKLALSSRGQATAWYPTQEDGAAVAAAP